MVLGVTIFKHIRYIIIAQTKCFFHVFMLTYIMPSLKLLQSGSSFEGTAWL